MCVCVNYFYNEFYIFMKMKSAYDISTNVFQVKAI